MILFIRADSSEVIIELKQDGVSIASKQWEAGRQLSLQINRVIEELCFQSDTELKDTQGIIVYEGPGSYTGLRISMALVNALGYALNIPVMGASGEEWQQQGLAKLTKNSEFSPVYPEYGSQAFTTKPKK